MTLVVIYTRYVVIVPKMNEHRLSKMKEGFGLRAVDLSIGIDIDL